MPINNYPDTSIFAPMQTSTIPPISSNFPSRPAPIFTPNFSPRIVNKNATMPITAAGKSMGYFIQDKETPTARASMLVATASKSSIL